MRKLVMLLAAVVAGCAFADRTANRDWVWRNFAPSNLVPRVEALEGGGTVPTKWATGNLTNANGVALVDLKDVPKGGPGGETWTQGSITSGRYTSAAFGDGVFVAGSGDGRGIVRSTDGVTWQTTSLTSMYVPGLCFGGGRFVAGTSTDGIWYSDDKGATWTKSDAPGANGYVFAYENGVFIAAGYYGVGILVSTDGATWEATSVTGGNWRMATSGGGVFLVGANMGGQGIQRSTDGRNWTRVDVTSYGFGLSTMGYGGGRFIVAVISNRGAYCSEDGITWTSTSSFVEGTSYQRALAWGAGRFLSGANYALDDGELVWEKAGTGKGWSALAYGNGRFVGGTYEANAGLWYSDTPLIRAVPVVQGIRINGVVLKADGDNVVDVPVEVIKAAFGIE